MIERFLALETAVWEALKNGDAQADAALLADHFLGVYPSGFATKSDHSEQVEAGPTVANYQLLEPRLILLSDSLVLLSYLAHWQRVKNGQVGSLEKMYVSSLWEQTDAGWKSLFSQDTPAEAQSLIN
ncbi:MAG: DUF4440 domain-containing protein [Chloroflexota bacterium]